MTCPFRSILPALVLSGLLLGGRLHAVPPISYAGGDGSTMEKAVVIKGGDEESGVRAEYDYLARHFPGYKKGDQGVNGDGKHFYDILNFTTAKGEKKTIYFDITGFYGKM